MKSDSVSLFLFFFFILKLVEPREIQSFDQIEPIQQDKGSTKEIRIKEERERGSVENEIVKNGPYTS